MDRINDSLLALQLTEEQQPTSSQISHMDPAAALEAASSALQVDKDQTHSAYEEVQVDTKAERLRVLKLESRFNYTFPKALQKKSMSRMELLVSDIQHQFQKTLSLIEEIEVLSAQPGSKKVLRAFANYEAAYKFTDDTFKHVGRLVKEDASLQAEIARLDLQEEIAR